MGPKARRAGRPISSLAIPIFLPLLGDRDVSRSKACSDPWRAPARSLVVALAAVWPGTVLAADEGAPPDLGDALTESALGAAGPASRRPRKPGFREMAVLDLSQILPLHDRARPERRRPADDAACRSQKSAGGPEAAQPRPRSAASRRARSPTRAPPCAIARTSPTSAKARALPHSPNRPSPRPTAIHRASDGASPRQGPPEAARGRLRRSSTG